MKQLQNAYLTGIEDIDKYLIQKPKLLGDENHDFRNPYLAFYDYFYQRLSLDQYKQVLETYYPQGYKAILNQFAEDQGWYGTRQLIASYRSRPVRTHTMQVIEEFTVSCIMSNTYTEEVVDHLLFNPHTKFTTKNLVQLLIDHTKDKEDLRILAHHSWYQVREVLAKNGLFLDQLKSDRSKAVRKIVQEQEQFTNY